MKLYNQLIITLILISSSGVTDSQEYLRMSQNEVVYDVDVIVFSRQLSQPSAESMNNAESVKTIDVKSLPRWDRNTPLIKFIEPPKVASDSEWEVPLKEQVKQADVLSWVVLDTSMNNAIINKLNNNPTIKPIFHQKWRQPASDFLKPQYVEISHLVAQTINPNDLPQQPQNMFIQNEIYADNSIDGQVAFSKQRYTHLHVKMNLYRVNAEGEQIIYEISQQKRINLGEWQYFDHQQMGVLAKVTAVELRPEGEP